MTAISWNINKIVKGNTEKKTNTDLVEQRNKESISHHKQHKPETSEQSLPLLRENILQEKGSVQIVLREVISERT